MKKYLVNGAARPDALRALDKARVAKTWQQYYEDRGYELWGFSPSPTARILAQAILDSNARRSERIEIVDWGAGTGEIRCISSNSVSTSSELTSRKRLSPWHAAPISNVRQAAYHCWAALVFMLAICIRSSSAEQDKECMPSSLTESSIC
jgi:hypothetical protein